MVSPQKAHAGESLPVWAAHLSVSYKASQQIVATQTVFTCQLI